MVDGKEIISSIIGGFLIALVLGCLLFGMIDVLYKYPQAAEKANQICQEQGYDFYEKFERIGILSNEPVAIECKYVQNYQEMDIDLRQTYGGLSEVEK